jgi:serine/threonine protein kinase
VTEIDAHLAASLSRRFRLIRQLGAGGMGAVYLAEQIAVGNRPVALKVLSRKLLDDPDFVTRFQNEAASTGRIHHANVVTIYESGQADDGTPYISMEVLEGESLRQALTRRGALPVTEVAEILQQAARGLNAAHKLGIIHRDLKPDNIFLTYSEEESSASSSADLFSRSAALGYDRPEKPQTLANRSALPRSSANVLVKLVDFGIAKLRESGAHTQTGMVLGTPAYMSFEQASGMRSDELDARSDIYSLGVVVYEMLTGRTPFRSDTQVGYLRMHMQEDPPPFRTVKPDLPALPQLESIVMKALTKDRDQRYPSALDFARAFIAAPQPSPRTEAPVPLPSTRIVSPPAPEAPSSLGLGQRPEANSKMRVKAKCIMQAFDSTACILYFPGREYEIDPSSKLADLKTPRGDWVFQFDRKAEMGQPLPSTKVVPPPATPEPALPVHPSASAPAPADIAVQTPPPVAAERIVEASRAQPQVGRPVAPDSRRAAMAQPPQFRTTPEPASKMKFVVIAVLALILIVAGVWYFSPSAHAPVVKPRSESGGPHGDQHGPWEDYQPVMKSPNESGGPQPGAGQQNPVVQTPAPPRAPLTLPGDFFEKQVEAAKRQGDLYYDNGEYDKAINSYEEGLKLDSPNSQLLKQLPPGFVPDDPQLKLDTLLLKALRRAQTAKAAEAKFNQ